MPALRYSETMKCDRISMHATTHSCLFTSAYVSILQPSTRNYRLAPANAPVALCKDLAFSPAPKLGAVVDHPWRSNRPSSPSLATCGHRRSQPFAVAAGLLEMASRILLLLGAAAIATACTVISRLQRKEWLAVCCYS